MASALVHDASGSRRAEPLVAALAHPVRRGKGKIEKGQRGGQQVLARHAIARRRQWEAARGQRMLMGLLCLGQSQPRLITVGADGSVAEADLWTGALAAKGTLRLSAGEDCCLGSQPFQAFMA